MFDATKIIEICRQHAVAWCGLFGSVARGEVTEQSDVDLLIKFSEPQTLLSHIALENEMTDALGRKVDLITEESLHPSLRPYVMKDLKVIYPADALPQ